MTWEIIAGFIALTGFIGTIAGVCVKVVVPLTRSIVTLNENVKNLCAKFSLFDEDNTRSHRRLWEHNEKQDACLESYGRRLHDLDGK
ncbi:MAG: hypothetical protein Q4C06_06545 [Bacillota bacterium]|nr:hypothetical protein [Bacillota bacterium]